LGLADVKRYGVSYFGRSDIVHCRVDCIAVLIHMFGLVGMVEYF